MMENEALSANRLLVVSGKGGVGKTAFIAIATKLLTQNSGHKLLIIDADPAVNLPTTLGVKINKTIGEVREEIISSAIKLKEEEERFKVANTLDYMVLEALAERGNFALLVMGHTETSGCFCPVNDLLRHIIGTLSGSFDITLVDGEAGIEQINRQVIRIADTLIVITDISGRGFQTATLIRNIVKTRKTIQCKKIGLVINRMRGNEEALEKLAQETGLEIFGFIPEDENITEYDLGNKSLLELPDTSPSVLAVRGILGSLGLVS